MAAASIAPIVAGGIVSGIGGGMLGRKGKNRAGDLMRAILAQYQGIEAPSVEEQKIILENLVQQGLVTPEEAQTVNLEDTAYNDINLDPRARQAQMEALSGFQDIASEGGLTAIDKLRMRDISDTFETERRGGEQAVIEDAKARGVYGSNLELVNRLMAGQGAANRASREGMDVAAMAQQARMDALRQSGALGGQIRGQEFNEASAKADAVDAIRRFNAGNKQSQINLNVGNRNEAQRLNLGEKQRISDTNVGGRNVNRERNSNLIQQRYQNRLSLADARARALAGIAGSEEEEQRRRDQLGSGLLGLGGSIISLYGGKR